MFFNKGNKRDMKINGPKVKKLCIDMSKLAAKRDFNPLEHVAASMNYFQAVVRATHAAALSDEDSLKEFLRRFCQDTIESTRKDKRGGIDGILNESSFDFSKFTELRKRRNKRSKDVFDTGPQKKAVHVIIDGDKNETADQIIARMETEMGGDCPPEIKEHVRKIVAKNSRSDVDFDPFAEDEKNIH